MVFWVSNGLLITLIWTFWICNQNFKISNIPAVKIFSNSFFGKICYLFSFPIFKKIKNTLDPRKYNGGIFLGLNAPVIKSHGGADALAFYYSIKLSAKILRGKLISRIQENFRDQNG